MMDLTQTSSEITPEIEAWLVARRREMALALYSGADIDPSLTHLAAAALRAWDEQLEQWYGEITVVQIAFLEQQSRPAAIYRMSVGRLSGNGN